jgi:hypothetical protein
MKRLSAPAWQEASNVWHHFRGHWRKKTMENCVLYSKENYPPEMNNLPEEVRERAISNANQMLADGDIRLHRKIITALAIREAMEEVES